MSHSPLSNRDPEPEESVSADALEVSAAREAESEMARTRPAALTLDNDDEVEWSRAALEIREIEAGPPRRRMVGLPILLFFATCLCTFCVGASNWMPFEAIDLAAADWFMGMRQAIVSNWQQGLTYMCCVLAILFAHEMGHFLTSAWYGIPASLPFFIPWPSPIGTMGAVIAMDGLKANRREMFDIGLAGPLAGLLLTLPILYIGVTQLDFTEPGRGIGYDAPLAVRVMLEAAPPKGYDQTRNPVVYTNQLNPFYAAGWVGLFITGLNMFPVSQLDGGHVSYTLFGTAAHWVARCFMILALVTMVWADALLLLPMAILVTMLGVDHPPTSDDDVELGAFRTGLGFLSLAIPFLCFPPRLLLI